jgi:phage FluMu gp28-like protein
MMFSNKQKQKTHLQFQSPVEVKAAPKKKRRNVNDIPKSKKNPKKKNEKMKHTKPAISKSRSKSRPFLKKREGMLTTFPNRKKILKKKDKEKTKHTKPEVEVQDCS